MKKKPESEREDARVFGRRLEDRALIKSAAKEAIREWLDDIARDVGVWAIKTAAAVVAAAIAYFVLTAYGWRMPHD